MMSKKRHDSWTSDEDGLLVETILHYIRSGKTQLEAFKEAAEKLSRTPAACGFRWNSSLRKNYLKEIEAAKESRKQIKPEKKVEKQNKDLFSIEQAISLLKEVKENAAYDKDLSILQKELERLREENESLKATLRHFNEAWQEIHNIWRWAENKNEHCN